MTPNIFTAFRTSLIGVVAATVLVLTAAAPANACGDGPREFLYSVGAVIPADHWRYLLTTGDLIVRVDPITGDRVSVETVTTTPWERALAVEEAQAQAEIRAERDALAAGNGPTYDEQVTYNRNHRRKDRGEFRAPTVTLVGCVNDGTQTRYTWRFTGGAYRTVWLTDSGVVRGDGKVRRNSTYKYTTDTDSFTMSYARTKARFSRHNLSMRENWTITYQARLIHAASCR